MTLATCARVMGMMFSRITSPWLFKSLPKRPAMEGSPQPMPNMAGGCVMPKGRNWTCSMSTSSAPAFNPRPKLSPTTAGMQSVCG